MSADARDLLDFRQALQALARRVEAVESAVAAPRSPSPAARPAPSPALHAAVPAAPPPPPASGHAVRKGERAVPAFEPRPGLEEGGSLPAYPPGTSPSDLRAALALLDAAEDVKDFPRFFIRLAQQTGLRMLLLKRWNSGLEVLLAEGLNGERPGTDGETAAEGRIPIRDDDLFAAVATDHSVYAGPVPVKHFPLDLALLLGRGRDRQVVVLPLPLRGRWNTFILLDASQGDPHVAATAELLARYALARLLLMEHGERTRPQKSGLILEQELARRGGAERARGEDPALPAPRAGIPSPHRRPEPAAAPPVARPGAPAAVPAAAAVARPAASAGVPGDGPVRSPAELATLLRDLGASEPEPPASQHPGASGTGQRATIDPQALLRSAGELPALPRVANHILALIADPNTTATKLEKAIVLDQALTAKILKIANSSFYGGLRDVNTVSEAIVRLGFVTIRNWTLVTAAKSAFLDAASGSSLLQIWQQSVLSAMASQLVAERVRHPSPESVFVGGLMQNIGQLALAKAAPDLFRQVLETSAEAQVPYHVVERDLLGFDHGALGALLMREWNLSDDLEEAVRNHHRLAEAEAARPLAAMIALGEEIAACSGSVPDEGLTIWEMSEAAQLLEVSEATYVDLLEKARRLRIDPRLFA